MNHPTKRLLQWLFPLCLFFATQARASTMPDLLTYACSPQLSEITITARTPQSGADAAPSGNSSDRRSRTCGKLTARLRSGYVHKDPLGPPDAPATQAFAALELRLGNRIVLRSTGLAMCGPQDSGRDSFGSCPLHWAVAVQSLHIQPNTLRLTVTRRVVDAKGAQRQTVRTYTHAID